MDFFSRKLVRFQMSEVGKVFPFCTAVTKKVNHHFIWFHNCFSINKEESHSFTKKNQMENNSCSQNYVIKPKNQKKTVFSDGCFSQQIILIFLIYSE